MLMRLGIFSLAMVFLLLLPSGFAFFPFFSFPPQPPAIFRRSDVNGEDVNVNILWAEEAWIDSLHVSDLNAETVTDYNVVGDVNAGGSIEAGVCFISDCFSSASDLDNWIDASGPKWEFNNFGIDVDGDIDGFDISAENDLSCINDLEVGDNADIHGALVVDEDVNVGDDFGVMGVSFFGGNSVFVADANFSNIGFSGLIFGDGSKLTNLNTDLDGGFANSVYLGSQKTDGGGA